MLTVNTCEIRDIQSFPNPEIQVQHIIIHLVLIKSAGKKVFLIGMILENIFLKLLKSIVLMG